MGNKSKMTDAMVEQEIAHLRQSPYVKLCRQQQRRMKTLYQLRWMDKKGRELAAAGATLEDEGVNLLFAEEMRYAESTETA